MLTRSSGRSVVVSALSGSSTALSTTYLRIRRSSAKFVGIVRNWRMDSKRVAGRAKRESKESGLGTKSSVSFSICGDVNIYADPPAPKGYREDTSPSWKEGPEYD